MFLTVSPNERGIVVIFSIYNEFLCFLGVSFRFCCPLCGCAKTTVTAMTAEVFKQRNPAVHIGGNYAPLSEFSQTGTEFFITEACEYKRSFLSLNPSLAIVLNAELDHTDCYLSQSEYFSAFETFCKSADSAVVYGDDPALLALAKKEGFISFGFFAHNDYAARNIAVTERGRDFDLCEQGAVLGRISLSCHGMHNVLNALAAAAAGRVYGLSFSELAEGLSRFTGVGRRFEFLGKTAETPVYSDYAHHPTELAALIGSMRETGVKKITVVFQPHTYTRTQSLCREFAGSLSKADRVFLLPVYAAREKPVKGADSDLIAREMKKLGKRTAVFKNIRRLYKTLMRTAERDEVIIFAGAGTVDDFGRTFIEKQNMRQGEISTQNLVKASKRT